MLLDSEARSRRKEARHEKASPGTTLDLMMLSNMKRVG
jgi:hypothetical protein